ncbi:Glutarate-semialdehyde dehydrogenase [Paenibacillus sp. CECT 9249]|uniref:aldehyde dehydrogenase family protein n=1 Tax=Paenibacillus sp. CECT 9249 TaxID=2845385 RepID=UPI001E2FCC5E|nr:aldehyde dehydrogenase family protein [Paenibacillus sp. CECT 9249]CAH0118933.1 Glutarate-semialdehyde dehydrogenase [Paenibacillus sp. CECT 9249]
MMYPMYIDGAWYSGDGKHVKDVISPATGETIGTIPTGTREDADRAVRAAHRAAPSLAAMTVFERAELCQRIADAIAANKEELAKVLSMEHGKPYHTEALGEVEACITSFREAAEQIKWMNSEIIPLRDPNKRAFAYRRPRGVYGVITPWNFPIGCASAYYLAPGLAAGNTIVWIPAPSTAAVASRFMRCLEEAGVPKGYVNLVIGEGAVVGDAVVVHELTSAVAFTGSTPTGNTIASRAKAKPCLLELGGNGPSIVLADADLEKASDALIRGSFANAGQICTSTERVLVHEAVADKLAELLKAKTAAVTLGDPFDPGTTMGPVHNRIVAEKVVAQVEDAVRKGAKVIAGGNIQADRPTALYVEPTVVDHVSVDALINTDETFGPVIPLIRFQDESELPSLIASSPYRLSAAIFSDNVGRAMSMAEELNFGFVHVNEAGNYWETQIPAGGTSGSPSGYGRSGGKWSIEEMSEIRTVIVTLSGEGNR